MLKSDVFLGNAVVTSLIVSKGQTVIFPDSLCTCASYSFDNPLHHKRSIQVKNCNKKGLSILFVNKAVSLKIHFISFHATYFHADAT